MADQVQVKLRKRLEALLKLPENQICADCNRRGPRWASANLGIFMCIECSGIHRNLGVHISFVRSVNLDSWTEKQVQFFEEWGNARANAYYEANVPANVHKPKEGDSVRVCEKYIRDKYEHKRWIAKTVPPKQERTDDEQQQQRQAEPEPARRTSTAGAGLKPVKRPEPVVAATPSPAVTSPATQVSLLDFMDDPVTPASPPVAFQQQQQPQFQQQQQNNGFGFSNFDTPAQPTPVSPPSASNDFLDFQTAPVVPNGHQQQSLQQFQQQQQQPFGFPQQAPPPPPVPQKPQASADAILSLYSGGGGAGGNPMMGGGMGGGMMMGQRGHNGMPQMPMMGGGGPMMMGGGNMGMMHQNNNMMMGQQQQPQYNMGGMMMPQQQQYGGGMQQQQQPMRHPSMSYNLQQPQSQFGMQNIQQLPSPNQPPVNPFSGLGNVQSMQSFSQPPVNPFQQQQQPQYNQFNQQQQQQWRM